MREHEYRGKDIKTGNWIKGSLVTMQVEAAEGKTEPSTWCRIFVDGGENCCGSEYEVIPETVGEYTGLKDKNGKMIFEGDILKPKQMNLHGLQAVCWDDFAAGFMFTKPGSKIGESRITEIAVEYCVVVGNIHDNPGLLSSGGK